MAYHFSPPTRKWRVQASTSGPPISLLVWLLTSFHSSVTQPNPSPVSITGQCLQKCEANWPSGHTGPYKFTCDYEPDCLPACESCPKELCDETLSGDKPWSKWHCPEDTPVLKNKRK